MQKCECQCTMFSAVMQCLLSLETPHLAASKHIWLSKLVLFVLTGGFPYLKACIGNRKISLNFCVQVLPFFIISLVGVLIILSFSLFSLVFLFLNIKSKMYRCTFKKRKSNWKTLGISIPATSIKYDIFPYMHCFMGSTQLISKTASPSQNHWESAEHLLVCLLSSAN